MNEKYGKKITGTTLFALLIGVMAFSGLGLAQALNGNGNGNVTSSGNGYGGEKVTLCHNGKNTITVGAPATEDHLAHGDTLGPCPES